MPITGINNKIECITSAPDAASYSDQIDDINADLKNVTDNLRLLDDGSFDADTFLAGVATDLKANVLSYSTHTDDLEQEINDNISNTIDSSATVNPANYY